MLKNEKKLSRRQLLKCAGVAGIGSVLLSTEAIANVAKKAPEDQPEHSEVPSRPFGKTGVKVSCLSLGGMFDIPSNQLLLKQALKRQTATVAERAKKASGSSFPDIQKGEKKSF
jgi:hypothetical protein